jgi:tetratricopeptide (TPR) repeat protein
VADTQLPAAPQPGPLNATTGWPLRCGSVPLLTDRFSTRPETSPDLGAAIAHAGAAALVPVVTSETGGAVWRKVCGKTQLAAYYAESQWHARAVDLLVWIDASSRESILAGYGEAAAAVSEARVTGTAQSIATAFLSWLRRTERRWLVVLDDLPDRAVVQGLWPSGRTGQLLLTAPSDRAVSDLGQLAVLKLGPFSRREAMSYLVARLSADPDQRRGAMDLIEDLGGEPLALTQATAVIGTSRMTCEDYRERFHRRRPELGLAGHDPLYGTAITWTLSVDRSDQMLPGGAAHACLAFAALLDCHGAPEAVFGSEAGSRYIAGDRMPPVQAQEHTMAALAALERAGLVTIDRSAEPAVVRMESVLQQAVRAATPQEMRDQAGTAVAAALLDQWPEIRSRACAPGGVRASAESLRRATAGLLWTDGCHPLLFLAGQSLDDAGMTGPAVDYWGELTSVAERLFGPGHQDSMALVERLAMAYVADGRQAELKAWYQRVLVEWASAYALHQPIAVAARISLGHSLTAAGLAADAVGVLAAALEDCERALGPDHPECQRARDELAAAYTSSGQLDEAIRMLRRALGDHERSGGNQDPGTIAARRRLAAAYLADGRMKDAISQYKKALSDAEKSMGSGHPDTIRTRGALAAAYHQSGRMAIAIQMYEQAYEGSVKALGPDHPDSISSSVSLAAAYYAAGRLTDGIRLYEDAVARGEKSLPPGHPVLKLARESLASVAGQD